MHTFCRAHRFALLRRTAVAALALVLVLPPISSASQRPQFRARVDLIQFQVRVTDSSGNFIPGLQASDFRLRVGGAERQITTAYEVNLADDSNVPAEDMPPAAWRQWVLFFDAAFNTPRGVVAAQAAAREFVTNQVGSRDLVGVATFNHIAGARLVVPLTRDRQQVLDAIAGLGLNDATKNIDRAGFLANTMTEGFNTAGMRADAENTAAPGTEPDAGGGGAPLDVAAAIEEVIRTVRSLEFDQYTSFVAGYAAQLGTVGDLLRTIRGRKHVVYFSQGFDDQVLAGQSLDALTATTDAMQENAGLAIAQSSGEQRFGSTEVRSELDATLETMRSADTVVHVVDPTGLGGGRDRTGIDGSSMATTAGDFNSRGGTRSALTAMADATGGEMHWDTNDLSAALATIEANNRSYYVLAFPRQGNDGEILELDVEVTQGGATVDAPEELAAPIAFADMSGLQKQIQLAEFVSKGIVETDLLFDVATAGFVGDATRSRLPAVIEVPWTQLEELADSGADSRVELEIYSYALDENNRMVDLSFGEANLNMEAMRGSNAAGLPFRYYDLLWSAPGERRVRVILRDKELGRISSKTSEPATVAAFASGEVAIGGPIAVDWDHPGLIMRGFDASKPPAHKSAGPVAYPFHVGENEVTPAAMLVGTAGSAHYAYFVAHNLGKGPDGEPQTLVSMALRSPTGEPIQLAGQEMVARYYDEATDGAQMVVKATLPPNLEPGFYGLMIIVNDQIKGANLAKAVPLWVEPQ